MKTKLPLGTVFKFRRNGEWEYGKVKAIEPNHLDADNAFGFECLSSRDPICKTAVHAVWKANDTLALAKSKSKKAVAPITFRQAFPNPDEIGASEYRAIHDLIVDAVFDGWVKPDKVLDKVSTNDAIAILEEFKGWATSSIAKLKGAVAP